MASWPADLALWPGAPGPCTAWALPALAKPPEPSKCGRQRPPGEGRASGELPTHDASGSPLSPARTRGTSCDVVSVVHPPLLQVSLLLPQKTQKRAEKDNLPLAH